LKSSRKRREGGFSLLEIVISLLILSIGVFGLAMVQLTAISARNPAASSNLRTATSLAQAALDRLREAPWSSLRSSPPDGFLDGPEGTSPAFSRLSAAAGDAVSVQGTTYYRVWKVTGDIEIPPLRTITVWCCWRQGRGPWRQAVLVTQRADVDHVR
jgi:type IV pilus assembly protein PilV